MAYIGKKNKRMIGVAMKESPNIPTHPPYIHTVKLKLAALVLCVCVLLAGAVYYLPGAISVSSSVNGRDLPIYCVQTDKPQIALSFDAACAGC